MKTRPLLNESVIRMLMHQETCGFAFDGFPWLLMALKANKAIEGQKVKSHGSQSSWRTP
jgi:hypothetical protein